MRMSNEAFEAAVRSRAAEYQKTQARRKRFIMTFCPIAACLILAVGIGYKNMQGNIMKTSNAAANYDATPQADNAGKKAVQTGKRAATQDEAEQNAAAENAPNQNDFAPKLNGEQAAGAIKNNDALKIEEPSGFGVQLTLNETVIQKGAKTLNLLLTNSGSQTVTVSSVQFLLSKDYPDGNSIGFAREASKNQNETHVAVPSGSTVPFAFELDLFTEPLTEGNYTLRLFDSTVHFTIQ